MIKKFICLIFYASALFASEPDSLIFYNYKAGVFFDYNINTHHPDFKELPGVPNCCPRFLEGNGNGVTIGALFEYLFPDKMSAAARLSFSGEGGLLWGYDYDYINYQNNIYKAKIRHELDITLNTLSLGMYFQYNFWDRFYVHAGPRFSFLIAKSFSQIEILKDPPDGQFETGGRTRNNTSGKISETASVLGFMEAGISYELPLNKQEYLFLAPEVFYSIPFTDIVKDYKWTVSQLRIGAALKYRPFELPVERRLEKELFIDTVKFYDDFIVQSVFTQGIADTIITVEEYEKLEITYEKVRRTDTILMPVPPPVLNMKVTVIPEPFMKSDSIQVYNERYYVTEMLPIIPYVFFEKDSAGIPARYISELEPQDFSKPEFDLNPVMIQRNVMNILGNRLRDYPDISITLTGTSDKNKEKGDCELASERAKNLKKIFLDKWGIDESRIAVIEQKKKCTPKNPTLSNNEDGNNDNRRVEINSSDDIRLFAPIVRKRFLKEEKITTKKTNNIREVFIENDFTGTEAGGGTEYNLRAMYDGTVLYNKTDTSLKNLETIRLSEEKVASLADGVPFELELTAKNPKGKVSSVKAVVPVSVDTGRVEVQRFSLTYFTVSWDSLSSKEIVEFNQLLQGLTEQPNVSVIGYTDYLGDPKINVKLSHNRANTVAEYIKNYISGTNIVRNEGVADKAFPPGVTSYSTPEERFLSRTVQIEFRLER